MKFFFVLISILFNFQLFAQKSDLTGRITDSSSGEPLAFVNVVYNQGKNGVVSNVDGFYKIPEGKKYHRLTFSLIGYESKTVLLDTLTGDTLNIFLKSNTVDLQEVVVHPGINPALRIIRQVTENRNRNNPVKMNSFSYTSYNKMHFITQKESPAFDSLYTLMQATTDTMNNKSASYILLMEFISERKFKYPDKDQEKIIASRVSGFRNPTFTLIATQLQSFSFYNDFFQLFDRYYLNPISPGSLSRYSFILEDTFYTEKMDTLFEISFHPIPGKNFDGMKGLLYINSNGYAIQNVIAEAQASESFIIKIQQKYELFDQQKWFPTQLNTKLIFKNLSKDYRNLTLVGYGTSYLRNIDLNPDISHTRFNNIILSVTPETFQRNDTLWSKYRTIPLTHRDSMTYHILDSIGLVKKYDQKLEVWETLSTGFIPVGYVNVDLRRFLNYNRREGFRIGIGLQTNNYMADHFTLGGHFAYGLNDKTSKYGAFIQIFPQWGSDTRFSFNYLNDVKETGSFRFVDDQFLLSTELYRDFQINRMDWVKGYETALTFRAFNNFKFKINLLDVDRGLYTYTYRPAVDETYGSYHITELGIGFKFTFNEKFVMTPRGRKISTGTRYPIFWFNYKQGISAGSGDFAYRKYEARLSKTFTTRRLGSTQITLLSGKADTDLPIGLLYNGHGNNNGFSFDSENSFGTMKMNEFYSSSFAYGFFRQNFDKLLFTKGNFKPELGIIFNAGIGTLNHKDYHQGINFNTLEKGYYETGIVVNKLINQKLFGYGIAVYYRLGPYAYTKTADNFAYKLAINYNFQ